MDLSGRRSFLEVFYRRCQLVLWTTLIQPFGVGLLVHECLVDEVEFITDVHYEKSVWMIVRGGRGCLLIVRIVLALKVV